MAVERYSGFLSCSESEMCIEKLLRTIIEEFPCHTIVIIAKLNLNIDPRRLATWMIPVIGNAPNVRNYLIAFIIYNNTEMPQDYH